VKLFSMYILSNKMGGGLMQLVAYGAQDIYLTGNPQITFFKVVYRRHTNFSMEAIEQTINGGSSSGSGSGTVTISRNGDLVGKVYVTSSSAAITNGAALVSEVTLEIGGQQIDKHTAEWMQIWAELTTPESKALGHKAMTGSVGTSGTTGVGMVQVPLQFYFCRNPGLALPLIALQYHEVKLKFTWGASANVVSTGSAAAKVFCDYIYLDTEERRRFAQVSHEYLIEQLQYSALSADTSNKLNFNHPVKELVWTSAPTNAYTDAKITLNGHDRFSAQEEEYFQLRQPMDHHTAVPSQNLPSEGNTSRTKTIVRSVDFTAASANIDSGAMRIPANSVVTDVTVLVTTALAFATATVGVSFGTTVGGTQLTGALDVDSLIGTETDVVAGVGNSTSAELNTQLGGQAAIGFTASSGEVTTATDIHGRVIASAGAFTAGTVSFILTYVSTENAVECRTSQMTRKVNVYSFALKPEEHQPSGTCNFSRIDTAFLKTGAALTTSDNVYAVNYNVLRVMSGMGGLAYSN
jgi:hypothetical protein